MSITDNYKFAGGALLTVFILSLITRRPAADFSKSSKASVPSGSGDLSVERLLQKIRMYEAASKDSSDASSALVHVDYALAYAKLLRPTDVSDDINVTDMQSRLERQQSELLAIISKKSLHAARAPVASR